MTPAALRALKPGQWITWTPSIWATPIDGKITAEPRPGEFTVEWDDGYTTTEPTTKLQSTFFQPREETR